MGGKGGGGGGGYYTQPADTSGYSTPEEAKATLARQAPIDLTERQGMINAKRAAAEASAPKVTPTPAVPDVQLGEKLASAVLPEPKYWKQQNEEALLKPRKLGPHGVVTTAGQQT